MFSKQFFNIPRIYQISTKNLHQFKEVTNQLNRLQVDKVNKIQNVIKTRQFSVSAKKNAIPPLVWIALKPLTKLSSILLGRGFRKWWQSLPQDKRLIFKEHLRRNAHKYGAVIGFSSLGSFVFYQTHLETDPVTQRERFMLFTDEQIKDIAQLGVSSILAENKAKLVDFKVPMAKRALDVANRLVAANKNIPGVMNIDWHLTVIDDGTVNAVAFPNGSIIVYTGLINHCKTDDDLAIIIAHEMSHAILKHGIESMSYARLLDLVSIGLIFICWAICPTDFSALISQSLANEFVKLYLDLPYSRQLESEADKIGLMIAARGCYDVRKSVNFWKNMNKSEDGKEKSEIPEYMSTHPSNEHRSQDLEKLMPDALKLRDECKCYELDKKIGFFQAITEVLKAAKTEQTNEKAK